METTRQFLDVEEVPSSQPEGSVTVPNSPARHRWALVGTLTTLLLLAAVSVELGDSRGAQVSPSKPATVLTSAAYVPLSQLRLETTMPGTKGLTLRGPIGRIRAARSGVKSSKARIFQGQKVVRMTAGDDDGVDNSQLNVPSLDGAASAVTPIGTFSPFRSEYLEAGPLGEEMEFSVEFAPRFALEFSRMQLEMQAGGTPDKAKMIQLADDLTKAADKTSTALKRMQMSTDFQAREFYKMTEAFALRKGETINWMGPLMRWQADGMRAFANGLPPPPPPPGIDMDKVAEQQKASQQQTLVGQGKPEIIDVLPFTGSEEAFKSETVKKEYEELCRDHSNLIKMGERYGGFDPAGKIAFLDAVQDIEDRWDVFYARFSLLGALNPEFKKQISAYLESMGISPAEYREVLREAHDIMRKDAEAERVRGP